jgi:hypothetical protein
MKKVIIVLLFLPLFSIAKEYTDVIQIEGKNADQLYKSAKKWLAVNFNSSKDVIQMDDASEKKIIGKGTFQVTEGKGLIQILNTVYLTFNLQFKDGRYKYIIEPTEIVNQYLRTPYDEIIEKSTPEGLAEYKRRNNYREGNSKTNLKAASGFNDLKTEIETKIQLLVTDLTETMKKAGTKDNW